MQLQVLEQSNSEMTNPLFSELNNSVEQRHDMTWHDSRARSTHTLYYRSPCVQIFAEAILREILFIVSLSYPKKIPE